MNRPENIYRPGSYYAYQGPTKTNTRQLPSVTSSFLSKRFIIAGVAILIVVLVFGHGLDKQSNGRATAAQNTSATSSKNSLPASLATTDKLASMSSAINSAISSNTTYDIGVSIRDLNSSAVYNFGDSNAFEAASTGKMLTAALFLHKVENGSASMTAKVNGNTAQYALQQMITISDNNSWLSFMAYIGGHPALQSYAKTIGLSGYTADGNTITAADMTTLLSNLYENKLLNVHNTQMLLSLMKQANHREYIADNIPSSATVYHKAGWLDDREMDTAIITDGTHSYALTIFSKAYSGKYNTAIGEEFFKDITASTTSTFLQ